MQDNGELADEHKSWWIEEELSILQKHYLEDEILPCSVKMEYMSAQQIKKLSRGGSTGTKSNLKLRNKTLHKCLYCPEEFGAKEKLRRHSTQTHKDKPNFWCSVCLEIFKCRKEYLTHYRTAHKDKARCIYCGDRFDRIGTFDIHMRTVHKKDAIKCNYHKLCGKYFKSQAEREEHIKEKHESGANRSKCIYCEKFILTDVLYLHIQREHKEVAIRCDLFNCAAHFLTEEDKKIHFEQVHMTEKFKCIYCKKYSNKNQNALYVHIRKHHKSEEIKCNYNKKCPTLFLTDEERQKHIREVHELKLLTKAKCIYCKKSYADYLSLFTHVNRVHCDVMIKCKWRGCHHYFLSKGELDDHFQQRHAAKDQKKNLQCQMCSYNTNQTVLLERHVVLQHGEENLQCPKCPKVYKSQIALSEHIQRIHSQKPKAKCSVCLREIRNITEHLRKKRCLNCDFVANCVTENWQHQGICAKKYKCKFCKSTFKLKIKLERHLLRMHLKTPSKRVNKKYCKECSYYYKSREELEKHKRSPEHLKNVQNGPFTCHFCQKQFASLRRIMVHIRYMHLDMNLELACSKCSKTFSNKRLLASHFKWSHSKPVKCDLCNALLHRSSLKMHKFCVHQILEK